MKKQDVKHRTPNTEHRTSNCGSDFVSAIISGSARNGRSQKYSEFALPPRSGGAFIRRSMFGVRCSVFLFFIGCVARLFAHLRQKF
jgi:hypothetical protein